MPPAKLKSEQAKRKIDRIQQLLRADPRCLNDLASELHMSLMWTRKYISELRAAGLVHVSHYEERKNSYLTMAAVFKWGPGQDAERPRLSAKERQKRHWDSVNSDPDRKTRQLAQRRARALTKKPKMDPLAAMFFGRVLT